MKISLLKRMNWNYCLVAILVLSIYPAYKNINGMFLKIADAKEAKILTLINSPTQGEVVIKDNSVAGNERIFTTSDEIQKVVTQMTEDGSEIKTTYDVNGNKIEIRTFFNNPKLKQLMLRTAADGQKQVYVYGQNGEVESLPQDMLDRVMSVSANEIASVAGIVSVKQEKVKPTPQEITQLPTNQNNTLENYQTPNQVQPTIENQPTTEKVEETSTTADKSLASKQNKETETPNLNIKP